MVHQVLLIEDEIKTGQSVKRGLEENGYSVHYASDSSTGLKLALQNNYDLIRSDILMPGIDGIELCTKLKGAGIKTPVLMLTALGSIENKAMGFESGAEDYLVKPFEFRELLMRINALIRRTASEPNSESTKVLHYFDVELNFDTRSINRGGTQIELTAREFALMEYFMRNPNLIISKPEIDEKVWDISFDTGTNVIEVYVNYLRNKIDKKYSTKLIHTAHGMGYILKIVK